ncbi:hypothetical protein [Schlesneria sp.]|uniref:hypothetical protein n=1 Tax=Schlesneria sp. TaxID=2762018 RepID=UPI002EE50252
MEQSTSSNFGKPPHESAGVTLHGSAEVGSIDATTSVHHTRNMFVSKSAVDFTALGECGMGDYFQYRRRWIGIPILFVTCLMAGALVDSYLRFRLIQVYENPREFVYWSLLSQRGKLTLTRHATGIWFGLPIQFHRTGRLTNCEDIDGIPYWYIVSPLTVLSACLLLTRPAPFRKRTPTPNGRNRLMGTPVFGVRPS